MAIEWPTAPPTSTMTLDVPDNWPSPPQGPANILVSSIPFTVNIEWEVPSPINMLLGGSFQLRAYAESVGPGQEQQIGPTLNVPVVAGQTNYKQSINVGGSTLLGEGQLFNGVPVSGVYSLVAVLQHLNPGPTWVSGFADVTIRMFLSP